MFTDNYNPIRVKFCNNNLCKIALVSIIATSTLSCSKKEREEKLLRELTEKVEREKAEEEKKRKELEAQELAKLKEQEAIANAEEEARVRAEEQRLADEQAAIKLAEEEALARQLDIERRQLAQENAFGKYMGTKYDELELLNGKVLKPAEVIRITPSKVTYMHAHGVSSVVFENLPEEIRELCLYDEELASIALDESLSLKQKQQKEQATAAMAAKEANDKKTTPKKSTYAKKSTAISKKAKAKEEIKKVKPKGMLHVRVIGSGKYGKKVEIKAKANVDGTITLDGVYKYGLYVKKTYKVKADEKFEIIVNDVKRKYTADFRGGGVTLDEESSSRKSGLSNSRGL